VDAVPGQMRPDESRRAFVDANHSVRRRREKVRGRLRQCRLDGAGAGVARITSQAQASYQSGLRVQNDARRGLVVLEHV
jgi:hypothetical protein